MANFVPELEILQAYAGSVEWNGNNVYSLICEAVFLPQYSFPKKHQDMLSYLMVMPFILERLKLSSDWHAFCSIFG